MPDSEAIGDGPTTPAEVVVVVEEFPTGNARSPIAGESSCGALSHGTSDVDSLAPAPDWQPACKSNLGRSGKAILAIASNAPARATTSAALMSQHRVVPNSEVTPFPQVALLQSDCSVPSSDPLAIHETGKIREISPNVVLHIDGLSCSNLWLNTVGHASCWDGAACRLRF